MEQRTAQFVCSDKNVIQPLVRH